MTRALKLATADFAAVFALGFAMGTVRTLFLIPRVGEVAAVLVELPLILTAAWLICGALRRSPRLTVAQSVAMGVLAFLLLMPGEAGLSMWLAGRSLTEHVALYAGPARRIGLGGQIGFAAFPFLRR